MSFKQVIDSRARFYVAASDAIEFAMLLPDESIDAAIMDPPYCSGGYSEAAKRSAKGQGIRSANLRKRADWFVSDAMGSMGLVWLLRYLSVQVARILKPGGSLIVFCDWRMVPNLAPALESTGVRHVASPIWDKGSAGLGVGFRHRYEQLLHCTKGVGVYYRADLGDILCHKRVPVDDRENQTEKPVALMVDLVTLTAPRGGVVVDFFTGSGSCGEAAVTTGRRFIGSEISIRSAGRARQRLAALMRSTTGKAERAGQVALFNAPEVGDAADLGPDAPAPPRGINAAEYLAMSGKATLLDLDAPPMARPA